MRCHCGSSRRPGADRLRAKIAPPRIMTMNGSHQLLAAAPLDLRTTHRDHGTVNCKGGVRDTPPAAESRRRPADKASSRLPFRKRPILLEPEAETQAAPAQPSRQRLSPAQQAACPPSGAGQSAADNQVFPIRALPFGNEASRCWKPSEYATAPSYGRNFGSKSLFLNV